MKSIRKCEHLLRVLQTAKPGLKKSIIKYGDKRLITAISEIILNSLSGNLVLSRSLVQKLRRHKQKLREIASHTISQKKKKKILQTGGFLSLILSTLLGAVLPRLFGSNGGSQ